MPIKFPHRDSLMEDLLKLEFVQDKNNYVYNTIVSEGFRDQGANSTLKRGSTSAEYLLARLARYEPGILNDYEQGKYPSVRQSAIDNSVDNTINKAFDNVNPFNPTGRKLLQHGEDDKKEWKADNISSAKDSKHRTSVDYETVVTESKKLAAHGEIGRGRNRAYIVSSKDHGNNKATS